MKTESNFQNGQTVSIFNDSKFISSFQKAQEQNLETKNKNTTNWEF